MNFYYEVDCLNEITYSHHILYVKCTVKMEG